MVKPERAPRLREWMTCTEAADRLGISRQSVNRMVNMGEFETLHALGERPIFVVKTEEVEELVRRRKATKQAS